MPEATEEKIVENTEENVENENEEEGQEEDGSGVDHPLDILVGCIDSIEAQKKRLKNKHCGDLKYELQHNIYPIIQNALTAIVDYMEAIEEDAEIDDSDEPPPEVQEAIQKSIDEIKNLTNNIIQLDKTLAGAKMPEPYSKIVDWAKENQKRIEEAEKSIETSATATVNATATINATATAEKKE